MHYLSLENPLNLVSFRSWKVLGVLTNLHKTCNYRIMHPNAYQAGVQCIRSCIGDVRTMWLCDSIWPVHCIDGSRRKVRACHRCTVRLWWTWQVYHFCLVIFSLLLFAAVVFMIFVGVLASAGWREVWRPSPKVDPGAFSGQRQGWKTPKRTPWQCTASVCVAGVHCWRISALLEDGVSRSREYDLLSVLSIYPRMFLCVFIVYCHI